MWPGLGALARRQRQRHHLDAFGGKPGAQRFEMRRRDVLVGQHRHPGPRQERQELFAGAGQQPAPDTDVIGAVAKGHMDRFAHHSFSNTSGRASSSSITRRAIWSIE